MLGRSHSLVIFFSQRGIRMAMITSAPSIGGTSASRGLGGWTSCRAIAITIIAWFLNGGLAFAQQVANPGFKSVGRGAPLAATLPTPSMPTNWLRPTPEQLQAEFRDLDHYPFVGPMKLRLPAGASGTSGRPPELTVGSAWNGAAPQGIQPLPIDIFTSKDFYKDRELWKDPRYFRCNSPEGLELQRGAIFSSTIGDDPPRTAAWGYCDRDYPREAIVSPYPFRTAQEHYEALLAETKRRGGPT